MAAPIAEEHGEYLRPKVGVGVVITSPLHPNCVIIGKRKNVKGAGYYGLPGGHLEFAETWEECAIRETLEETGLSLTTVTFDRVINAVVREDKYHYVVIFIRAEVDLTQEKEPKNLEPNKCEGWEWCEWDKLPKSEQLFVSLRVLKEAGYNPFSISPS